MTLTLGSGDDIGLDRALTRPISAPSWTSQMLVHCRNELRAVADGVAGIESEAALRRADTALESWRTMFR